MSCCGWLLQELKDEALLCLMTVKPFSFPPIPTPPTVFMMSDGGHGGMRQISFCPFCGESIDGAALLEKLNNE